MSLGLGHAEAAGFTPNLEHMAEIEITQELEPAKGASIAEQRRALPDEPGVYIFRNSDGKVLYVGKARSVRKRVGGHFSGKTRTRAMTEQATSIEFLVTNTEADALLDAATCGDVVDYELDEVRVAVGDDRLCCRLNGCFARPRGLPGGAVAVQSGARGRDPLAQPVPRVAEVAVPRERRRG